MFGVTLGSTHALFQPEVRFLGWDEGVYYRPQTKFAKVMFLHVSVCPRGGVPGGVPPWAGTPSPQCMLGYGQQAGGTHPTGMYSCFSGLLQCPPPAPDPRESRVPTASAWSVKHAVGAGRGRNLSAGTHSRQGLFCRNWVSMSIKIAPPSIIIIRFLINRSKLKSYWWALLPLLIWQIQAHFKTEKKKLIAHFLIFFWQILCLSSRWCTTTGTEDRESPSTGAARRMLRDSFNKRWEKHSLNEHSPSCDRNTATKDLIFKILVNLLSTWDQLHNIIACTVYDQWGI